MKIPKKNDLVVRERVTPSGTTISLTGTIAHIDSDGTSRDADGAILFDPDFPDQTTIILATNSTRFAAPVVVNTTHPRLDQLDQFLEVMKLKANDTIPVSHILEYFKASQ